MAFEINNSTWHFVERGVAMGFDDCSLQAEEWTMGQRGLQRVYKLDWIRDKQGSKLRAPLSNILDSNTAD